MKVTNTNGLAYSLLLKSGKYAVLEAGESADLELAPAKIEEYRGKGFEVGEAGRRRAKAADEGGKSDKSADEGAGDQHPSGVTKVS